MSDTSWYMLAGSIGLLAFVAICAINIRIQRARRREEAHMTPDELHIKRAEEKAFQGIWRRR